jgi:hypothetical protein
MGGHGGLDARLDAAPFESIETVFGCVPVHIGGKHGHHRASHGRAKRHQVSRQIEPDRPQNDRRASNGHDADSDAPDRFTGSLNPSYVASLRAHGAARGREESVPVGETRRPTPLRAGQSGAMNPH